MDFDDWQVDLKRSLAVHSTGFRLTVEGDPRRPTGVLPGRFPDYLSAAEQAALLRRGINAIARKAVNGQRKDAEAVVRNALVPLG